jgi:hypothetical protein
METPSKSILILPIPPEIADAALHHEEDPSAGNDLLLMVQLEMKKLF